MNHTMDIKIRYPNKKYKSYNFKLKNAAIDLQYVFGCTNIQLLILFQTVLDT